MKTDSPSSTEIEYFEAEESRLVAAKLRRTVKENPFIRVVPTDPQATFLVTPVREILYGGAAGGGKSAGLLMAALQYVTVPGYAAILFRRSFADLNLPRALIPLSHEWLTGTDAVWNGQEHQWRFPSGATLNFGYLQNENDKYRYQSSAFTFIGFDELTHFSETQYRYMFSRLRKTKELTVPLRMRAGSNPGGIGHEWVRSWFIDSDKPDRLFMPAMLEDNPHLDRIDYEESLKQLDPVTRAQLRHGDWRIRPEGNLFKREWFETVENVPPLKRVVRGWDFAATEEGQGDDPDYTASCKIGLDNHGNYYIFHVFRGRLTPQSVENTVKSFAVSDGKECDVRLEQEPGSAGKALVDHYQRNVLPGYACRAKPATGDKVTRSGPFSAACEQRRVKIVAGTWNNDLLDELTAFPQVAHDDQVDAAVNAFDSLGDCFEFDDDLTGMVASAK